MSYRSSVPRLPLSPASPPDSGVKQQSKDLPRPVTPQTPSSPEHMSVATKRYAPSYSDGGHTNEMASRSPGGYVAQTKRPSISSSSSQQPNSLKRAHSADEQEMLSSKRQKKDDLEEVVKGEISVVATNHDRQADTPLAGEAGAKVLPEQDSVMQDVTERDQAELDSTFKDVGPALLTRKTTHKRAAVDMNQHLLGKYGLNKLLESVARIDPDTGEKINKLRKSYEGQIKAAQLPGRNKPFKQPREEPEPSKLHKLAIVENEEFAGKQSKIEFGDLAALRAQMQGPLRLNSGVMTKATTTEWDDILGHDIRRPAVQQQSTFNPALLQAQQARQPNGTRPAQPALAPDKMKTRGKKRGYGDANFEGYHGYAEGFSEPDDQSDRDGNYVDKGKRRKRD